MGTRTEYAPGTFCWIDLQTSDQEGAKSFYADLFGWEFEDLPVGDGIVYSMARLGGHDVAAVAGTMPGDESPPHWNSYVAVESADAAAAAAAENGGTVLAEPFDVLDSGRMAVIADPAGAALCLWQAREHVGAGLVNAEGALTWNDLATPSVAAVEGFYRDLFGWDLEAMDTGGGPVYSVIRLGDRSNGGMREQEADEAAQAPPNWAPYIAVASCDATMERATGAGASVLAGPMDIPSGGRIAVLADPQGAAFMIWEGPLED